MDATAFEAARAKVRVFCLPAGSSLILIRDAAGFALADPMTTPAAQLARLLLFLIQANPTRIADPDDEADIGPTFVAMPSGPMSSEAMLAVLNASADAGPFLIDMRLPELVQRFFPLGLNIPEEAGAWERALRNCDRLGALLVCADTGLPHEIRQPRGQRVLIRRDGRELDMSSWLAAFNDDKCVQREAWRRRGYDARGRA
jgi:hypothetical protein